MKENKSALTYRQRRHRVTALAIPFIIAIVSSMMCLFCFAAVDTSGINATLNNITLVVQAIGGGMAIVCIVWIGIKYMTGGREGMLDAKKQTVCLVVGLICVCSAPAIKSLIVSMSGFH
ncbi:MAG: pilin [Oscillospiraceae bacterium]|jgi:type IV secretory pathway VirB2 component (pilin)|nr:pilin [Oscillospiraceae bacterium]